MSWKPPTLAMLAIFWASVFLDQGRSMAGDGPAVSAAFGSHLLEAATADRPIAAPHGDAPRIFEATTWYADNDGDGYGDPGRSIRSIAAPVGYVDDGTDCDDTQADVHPGADEICNGRDDDCDGLIDEASAVDTSPFHLDADGDGFGSPDVSVETCTPPPGFVADDTDCDDTSAAVHPGASEICDGIDNDCDGFIDDSSSKDAITWYRDADGDQHGAPGTGIVRCEQPAGYVASGDDCDDHHADASPEGGGCEPGAEAILSRPGQVPAAR